VSQIMPGPRHSLQLLIHTSLLWTSSTQTPILFGPTCTGLTAAPMCAPRSPCALVTRGW
jgi:hypothetical protein